MSVVVTACGGSASTDTHPSAPVVKTIVVNPAPALVAVGGSVQFTAHAVDSAGITVQGATPTFQSSDPATASIAANGLVSGLRAGAVTISATYGGAVGTSNTTVVPATAINGHVLTVDNGPFDGMFAGIEYGSGASAEDFTSAVDGAGAFRVNAPLATGSADSMGVLVDAPAAARRYHPTLALVPVSRIASAAIRPMLVPKTTLFSTPVYPSSSVPVSLQSAFQRVCTDDTNANCNSFYPQVWKSSVILWNESDLPVPLAFYTSASTSPISASDSIALWNIIAQMHNELGRPLFKPATLSSLAVPDANGYSKGAVLVWVDNTLTGFAGYTNWIWDGNLNMLAAKTRVTNTNALTNRSLMTHELLHALGFHHTCAWTTVMGGYGCGSASGATISDAAAFGLGYQIRRTIRLNAATTTLGDALRGEQLREAGAVAALAPLGGPVTFAAHGPKQVLFGGRLVSADGAP